MPEGESEATSSDEVPVIDGPGDELVGAVVSMRNRLDLAVEALPKIGVTLVPGVSTVDESTVWGEN
jgi:hypothetical protein